MKEKFKKKEKGRKYFSENCERLSKRSYNKYRANHHTTRIQIFERENECWCHCVQH